MSKKAPTPANPASDSAGDSTIDPVSRFEQSLEELEALVEKLESGDLRLEDSLQAFERGVVLTKECQSALKTAELRIEQLMGGENGKLVAMDASGDENA